MAWIVVALVLAVAVGPILWLLPSKRDKRIAELRAAARRAGLVVETVALPKVDAAADERVSAGGTEREPSIDCAAYRLLLPKPLRGAPCWRLLKSQRENRFLPGWTTLRPPRNVPPDAADYWQRIGAVLDALPGGCLGVDANEEAIAWLGQERPGDSPPDALVRDVRQGLEAIAEIHAALV